MKIGILLMSSDPYYRGGVNSYIHGLIGGLTKEDKRNEYFLIVYKRNRRFYQKYVTHNFHLKAFSDENRWIKVISYFTLKIFTAPFLRNLYYSIEYLFYFSLIRNINRLNLDIIYSPSAPFFPMGIRGALIVSPHDVQHLHYPHYFSTIDRWDRATSFFISAHLADVVQASTNFMKQDFNKMLNIPLKKIKVIPEGVMDTFSEFKPKGDNNLIFLNKYNLKPGYLFYPAQHWPHKNHITLLKAIALLKNKYSIDLRVVFTGKKQAKFNFLYTFVRDNNLEESVKFLGNIELSELFYAYHNSFAVVIPVVYESSSLPVKEAMAMGIPVIASKNGANEEINIDDNIILFKTYDYKDLAEKIRFLLKNRKIEDVMVRRSKEIVKKYSWRKVAKQYIKVFEEIQRERGIS